MINYQERLREVLSQQYFAVLNTVDNHIPYCNLVSYAITDDYKYLVFFTKRDTRKFRNIKDNGNISLLIDNRTNSPTDIKDAIAVTLLGTATENPENDPRLKLLFTDKHSHLKEFVDSSDVAIVKVRIREIIIAGFAQTQRITLL